MNNVAEIVCRSGATKSIHVSISRPGFQLGLLYVLREGIRDHLQRGSVEGQHGVLEEMEALWQLNKTAE